MNDKTSTHTVCSVRLVCTSLAVVSANFAVSTTQLEDASQLTVTGSKLYHYMTGHYCTGRLFNCCTDGDVTEPSATPSER